MNEPIVPLLNAANQAAVAEPYIDKKEVARRLGLRGRTVDDWMRRGLLPFYKPGHFVRFRWSEVQAHLRQICHVCRPTGVK